MRKLVYLIIFFSFLFFSLNSHVFAGYCAPGLPGQGDLDCDYLGDDPITGEAMYNCQAGGDCCTLTNNCPPDECFLPGTMVKSGSGEKTIEDIKVGDRVTSFVDNKITESKVSKIFERKRDFYYSLIAGDYSVKASAEHPFYIGNNEYKKISELKKGDTVYVLKDNKLEQKTVTSNTKIIESTPVYNMTVDNTNTYFANGFAVHNKGGGCACLCGGCWDGDGETPLCWAHDHDPSNPNSCLCAHPQYNQAPLTSAYSSTCLWGEVRVLAPEGSSLPGGVASPQCWTGNEITNAGSSVISYLDDDPRPKCGYDGWINCHMHAGEEFCDRGYWTYATICVQDPNFVDPYCPQVTSTPTPTPTLTPTPTPTQGPQKWTKLKNASFVSKNSIDSKIPSSPTLYDSVDDNSNPYFILDQNGVVMAPSINLGTNPLAKAGSPEYMALYSPSYSMTPALFLSYVKARKTYKTISSINEIDAVTENEKNGIYEYTGPDLTISTMPDSFKDHSIVFISTGKITIDMENFTPTSGNIAILSNDLEFTSSVKEATGIFIANTLTTGETVNQGLKIIGNLVALTSMDNKREWSDQSIPSLFVVFDQKQYISLLPYLSMANYQWRQAYDLI